MLNDVYFKTTCNIRPHFLGLMGGLKMEGALYMYGLNSKLCIGTTEEANHFTLVCFRLVFKSG